MATLYEVTGQLLSLQDSLATETDLAAVTIIMDTMEGLDFEFEAKADGYAKIIRNLTSDVEGLKAEIDRLQSRKKTLENNISALKNRLEDSMIQTGKEKFKTELFSFGIQNNPPKVVIDDYSKIPAEYLIEQEPKIDNKSIKEFLQKTDDQRSFFAHLEQGRSLRIR